MEQEEEETLAWNTAYNRGLTNPRIENPGQNEQDRLITGQGAVKVYKRRWYVLGVFSLLNTIQGTMWNTWGPISDSAILVFGWSDAEIGLFATLGNLTNCLTVFFASYMMDVFGLRVTALCYAMLMVVGTGIRCISSQDIILYWMSVITALLSGLAGAITFASPALFASVWFPPSQRSTANAIMNMFVFLGMTLSFLLGPSIVHYVEPQNGTHIKSDLSFPHWSGQHVDILPADTLIYTTAHSNTSISDQREQIMYYMYSEAGIAAFLFLLVLVYFPAKPPLPPSISASTPRLQFKAGFWKLAKSSSFWLITLAYAIPAGVFVMWGSVLNVNLQPIGVSQDTAAQLGLYYNLAGGVAAVAVSSFADHFTGHMKVTLIVLYVLASGALCWICLISEAKITFDTASLFVAAILASIFVNSGVALFYELACETCYPVAEGIIGGFLTLINNIVGIIFLLLLYIPNIGKSWMNWTMFGAAIVGIPLLLAFKPRYARLELDTGGTEEEEAPT